VDVVELVEIDTLLLLVTVDESVELVTVELVTVETTVVEVDVLGRDTDGLQEP
jgi:hypothetical protein